eukprot:200718-Pleurochrysis_carterae.AAC.1
MTEEIWAGSPTLFKGEARPVGQYFQIDTSNRGIKRYSFTFPGPQKLTVEWAVVFIPQCERADIGRLHVDAAKLLVEEGVPDLTATEHRYLPAGWATFECSSKTNRPHVSTSLQHARLRLPYARK